MESRNALKPDTILKGKAYQYRIIKVLGQGSFGITYLATVKMEGGLGAININVAIKEFFMGDINGRVGTTVTSGSSGGLYEDYKRKFIREADNLSKLQHPNIIKVIEAFEANNTVYYAMEFIDGGSLDDYISKRHGLQEGEAIRITKQIGDALSFMHSKGMLHLDMKPGNIMMKSSGEVVLIDFGLSKQYTSKGEPESSTKVGAGTPGYAPIEQANYREGKGFPVTMDVYALGATLFKMLTGIRPPEASEILNEGFPANELQDRHVSNSTIASITKAMAPITKDRYQTVDAFILSFDDVGMTRFQKERDQAVDDLSHSSDLEETTFDGKETQERKTQEQKQTSPLKGRLVPELKTLGGESLLLITGIAFFLLIASIGAFSSWKDDGLVVEWTSSFIGFGVMIVGLLMSSDTKAIKIRKGQWLFLVGSLLVFVPGLFVDQYWMVGAFFLLLAIINIIAIKVRNSSKK